MSRTGGRVAIVVLVSILVASSVAIARSEPARVRFLAWRAGASDPEVRRKARLRLLEIGRPSIDGVLADIFLREVRERWKRGYVLVHARRSDFNELGSGIFFEYQADVEGHIYGSAELDPVARAFEELPSTQRIVLLRPDDAKWLGRPGDRFVVALSCPLDEGNANALRAGLAEFGPGKR
jgi:hypothetical protein